jgi:hypothetical protein
MVGGHRGIFVYAYNTSGEQLLCNIMFGNIMETKSFNDCSQLLQ